MSDSFAPHPSRRSARGYHLVHARAGGHDQTHPTHTVVDELLELHYGAGGIRTLEPGTPVTVLAERFGLSRFTYPGCSGEYAIAASSHFAPLEPSEDASSLEGA